MIIPTNPRLLDRWRSHFNSIPHTRPKVPYVQNPDWRTISYDFNGSMVQLIHRREIGSKSPEWQTANEIWDEVFVSKKEYKSHRDLDWDYLLIYIREGMILAAAMIEVRCIDPALRYLYKPFGIPHDRWPVGYSPAVFLTGVAVADRKFRRQGIGSQCVQAACMFASKLLNERAGSPWNNAFGDNTSNIPITIMVDNGDEKAESFWVKQGFRVRTEADRERVGYASWTAASRYWLPNAEFEFQMVKWVE
jgi:GNAT superfamily N-acetyltransferase